MEIFGVYMIGVRNINSFMFLFVRFVIFIMIILKMVMIMFIVIFSSNKGNREIGKSSVRVENWMLKVNSIIILIINGIMKLIRCIIVFCISSGLKGIFDIMSICLFWVSILFVDW